MPDIKELRQRKADLVKQGRAVLDAADENGNLTAEQLAEHDGITKSIESVNAAIARQERQMDEERQLSGELFAPEKPKLSRSPDGPFRSFGEQLQAIAAAGMNRGAERDSRLIWGAATGANEAVPSEGGFLVQKDFSTVLLEMMHETGAVLSRVRRIPISTVANGIKLPMVDESSRANGSRWGGVQAYWADEAATVTASKPKFRELELSLKKLFGLGYATDELLRDASALESIMTQAFVEELVFKTEDAIVNGTGSGQPLGILNSGALVTVNAESGQAASTVRTENVINMYSRLPSRSRTNAVWLINQDIEPQLYQLTLGSGTAVVLLYRPAGVEGPNANSPFGTLLGRPVIPVEYSATLGTVGDIILVDPTQYLMIDKDGVQQDSSMHVRFINDEMTFRFIFRVDGQPAWRTAVTPFKGSNTQSPYVALATRS